MGWTGSVGTCFSIEKAVYRAIETLIHDEKRQKLDMSNFLLIFNYLSCFPKTHVGFGKLDK